MTKIRYGEEIADRISDLVEIEPLHIDKLYYDFKHNVHISTLQVIEKLLKEIERVNDKKSSNVSNIPPLHHSLL